MKNRLFALLLVVALVVTVSVFAVGAEEQATNPFADQTGEVQAYCAHCGGEKVTWAPIPLGTTGEMETWKNANGETYVSKGITHFYLTESTTLGSATYVDSGETYCVELNGFTWSRSGYVYFSMKGGTVNIFDSSSGKTGTMCITAAAQTYERHIEIGAGGTVNQYGGNLTHNHAAAAKSFGGCVWMNSGTYNMHGGTMDGGNSSVNGGAVGMSGGTFNLEGGTITGNTTVHGGAVCVQGGTFNVKGGTITGTATVGGGGIYVNGGTVNMIGGELKDCETTLTNQESEVTYPYTTTADGVKSHGKGGAVFVDSGTFSMSGGSITNAKASHGGAIAATSTKTAKATVNISGKANINGQATTRGGAIAVYGGKYWGTAAAGYPQIDSEFKPEVTITGGTITGEAPWGGGGIYIDNGGTVNMEGGNLLDCKTTKTNEHWDSAVAFSSTATTSYGKGGGVLVMHGAFNMSGGNITGCEASYGGGIFISSKTVRGEARISGNAVIENCWAKMRGGGIGVVQGKYWYDETKGSDWNGDGKLEWVSRPYDNRGFLEMTGGTLRNNTVDAASYGNGGAIFLYTTDASVSGVNIIGSGDLNNKNAYLGGAIYVGITAKLDLENVNITDITASQGAIYLYGEAGMEATLNIKNCVIDGTETSDNCGGIIVYPYCNLNMTDTTIQNTVSRYGGGALHLRDGSNTVIKGGLIKNCEIANTTEYPGSGAGLYLMTGATATVEGLKIEGCKTPNTSGGSVWVGTDVEVTFKDCEFIGTGDLAKAQAAYGGNIFISSNATVDLINCEIKDGAATLGGGNIHLDGTTGAVNVTLTNCTVSGGKAGSDGGNINVYKSNVTLTNCTVSGGKASSSGGNINANRGNVTLNGNTVINGEGTSSAWAGHNIRMIGGTGTLMIEDATVEKCPKGGTSVSIEPGSYVTLAGTAFVDFLLVRYDTSTGAMPTGAMTVKEGYTGKVWVTVDLDTLNAKLEPGTAIGDWMAQDGYENTGAIYIHHIDGGWMEGKYTARPVVDIGDTFKVATMSVIKDGVEYGVTALPETDEFDYVKLYGEAEMQLSQDTTIHLNGQTAEITTNGNKVSVMDSKTNDGKTAGTPFTVDNAEKLERYVKNEANGYQYVIVENNDGTFTSNRVQVTLDKIAIKPSQTGIYYITTIKTNADVQPFVKWYGTAVSVGNREIDENFLSNPQVKYTEFGPENIKVDEDRNISMTTNSALISGILTPGDEKNATYAATPIKANSYIKVDLGGGNTRYIMADKTFEYSLNDVMKKLDAGLNEMENQSKAVQFYNDWISVFENVELPNLEAAANAAA